MIPIPKQMQHLPKDKRGYPVPAIVKLDVDGTPLFTVNDHEKSVAMLHNDCCHICGTKLLRGRWFVGGPLSAFHPRGVYFDGPMHTECKDFALQVCPWLAAPRYSKRIDTTKAKDEKALGIVIDHTQIPTRPEPFVAVLARGQRVLWAADEFGANHIRPARPFIKTEYWMHGERLEDDHGHTLALQRMDEYANQQAAKARAQP